LWADGECVFCREESHTDGDGARVLAVRPAGEHPSPAILDRLAHEYGLKDELDDAWSARPLQLVRERGQTILMLKDPGGEPLDRLIGPPMEIGKFLRLAVALSAALGRLHGRGLIHKDIKPAHVLVNVPTSQVWLTGFGIASRLARERRSPDPPERLEGTLTHMAPEQTGRMNRSIDSRSDLYSLGVTLYQMLTGSLPFTASDPMEWVHCHIAKNPIPPGDRLSNVPAPVSAIIMKLLAKAAEDRYQTAAGLEHDLRRCLCEVQGQIEAFPLGERDISDRLLLPDKLYGREREISTLLASFDRSVNSGTPEFLLVSGYSGIGKSSVVNELHKAIVPARGLFASGKFDQYKRDIPYSTLAQAFQSLIRLLLAKSDPELAGWREALREALGPNGRLIIDLVPELKLIVGDQPPVPELPLHDAQRRFQLVFRRFLAVFARPEHPLALFLDDLQWLDSATLDLLEDLLTLPDVRHLMLIGAYRDNEVNLAHPLIRKLETIRKAGAVVHEIILAPLAREDLGRLIGDALHCEPGRVTALAELIHEKTAGNPFFVNQLISVLVEEGLLTFDYGEGRWLWDLNRIRAKGYTDNVVGLLVGKLNRLPVEAQHALQLLACMGNSAEFNLLEMVSQQSNEQVHGQLWEAMKAGLIFRTERSYKFLHDRVQEAAYSLIPQERRAGIHLRVGRFLASHIPPATREERIFEIVNQLNRGVTLVTSTAERLQIAELNLIAGRRARASTAYKSALVHLAAGEASLSEEPWERHYGLKFSLALHRAECEFLTGELLAADERLSRLQLRAVGSTDLSAVACLRMALYTTDRPDLAVEVGVEQLRSFGIEWSAHPSEEEVRAEYDALRQRVGDRPIETLVDLASTRDPSLLALMEVLRAILSPALHTERKLHDLALLRMASLSLEHGYCDGSPLAFAQLSMVIGPLFGHYGDGFRFGHLGVALVEREDLARFCGKVYCVVGYHVLPWTHPIQAAVTMVQRALELAEETGDLLFVAYCQAHLISLGLASGAPLDDLEVEAERYLQSTRRMRFSLVIEIITTQLVLIRTLRGLTTKFGYLVDVHAELRMEHHLSGDPPLAIATCWYWIRKMQARYLAGDYAAALDASSEARPLLDISPSHWETAEFYFYSALSRAAFSNHAGPDEKQQHFEALKAHHDQLKVWAQNCPENFENGAALVGAEVARIEGRPLDAANLYEEAIRSARANGFIHNEALAYELAARFYAARGFKQFADLYLRNARNGYLRWGAVGKVRQLDETYPDLKPDYSLPGPTSTIGAPVEQLDLATVIKVSQAVSGEIALESLIDTLMRTAMAQAGAERALLIMPSEQEPRIGAEATISGNTVTVRLVDEAVTERVLPESVLHYVLRTRESVILDDAAAQSPFGVDSYIRQRQARSILCLPLLNQAKLIGVLYLENNLTPRVFAPARTSVLKLLASQAAIALENARLYDDLREREARIRRLVDSNIIGIFIGDTRGRIIEANDAFLEMLGYDHDDVISGRMRWTKLTPTEWAPADEDALAQLSVTGTCRPYEKEYYRKDGSRVPVLVGGAFFERKTDEGVVFVIDMSDRKRAVEALRKSEAKFSDYAATASDWLWEIGPDYKFTLLTENAFDSHPAYQMGTACWDHALDLETEPEKWRLVRAALDSRKPFRDFVYCSLDGNGSPMYVKASGKPVFDANGEFRGYRGTGTDVTELMRAQEALRESERSSRSAIDGIAGLVAIMAPNAELETVNRQVLEYFGRSLEWLKNWGTNDAVHPEDLPRVLELFKIAMASGSPFNFELRLRRFDGEYRWFDNRGVPIRDDSGRIVRWYVLLTDIEDRTRALARLDQMQSDFAHMNRVSMMGELVASLSHEIKQPIATARNNARAALNFLDKQPPDLGEVKEALGCIVGDADRAGDIIDRIRDHIKKAPLRNDRFDLNVAINEIIELAKSAITENGVSVQTRLAERMKPVQGDRVQVQQVVLNLILNAIEAMGSVEARGRELLVSTEQSQTNDILVAVRDSGPGIGPESLDRVFEAFYTTKSGGMGMGLSICRSIIDAHGGRLWAEANELGGTIFRFTVPNAEEDS
jgi:PAS domain S-box-containing protein